MKRDMSIIRDVLFEVEASAESYVYIKGVRAKHAVIMQDAGLIIGEERRTDADGTVAYIVERLTWSGHELLDAIRSDTIWAKAQETVLKPAGGFVFDTFMAWLKVQISAQIGVPL